MHTAPLIVMNYIVWTLLRLAVPFYVACGMKASCLECDWDFQPSVTDLNYLLIACGISIHFIGVKFILLLAFFYYFYPFRLVQLIFPKQKDLEPFWCQQLNNNKVDCMAQILKFDFFDWLNEVTMSLTIFFCCAFKTLLSNLFKMCNVSSFFFLFF